MAHPMAGKHLPPAELVNVPRLVSAYYANRPDPRDPGQRVSFGTSGHRGSAFSNSFNEAHIVAITEAICRYRQREGVTGPLFLGMDTHALAEPAFASALEVLAAHEVDTLIDKDRLYTPTPGISHAILAYNRGRKSGLADGIVITPSHNPPPDGGFKYNPPSGGPADTSATKWIENTANELMGKGAESIPRIPFERALGASCIKRHDYIGEYVNDLKNVVDMDAISSGGARIGIDPLGGASVHYYPVIIERYRLNASVVSVEVDPTFRFMTADWDGKIRMDCSSPYAMVRLVGMRDRFDVAFGNDTDADRHGIVTRSAGLMNPNHYLAVAISYLYRHRERWSSSAAVGKTAVSSSIIDRVAKSLGRKLVEVPVGFKWFVDGLMTGSIAFGGEESAGASFLRRDGSVWTTDKDGIIMGLLAAEIIARTGRDPGEIYSGLTGEFGAPVYERIDAPATAAQKEILKGLSPEKLGTTELAGEKISSVVTKAPGNNESLGGVKAITEHGWFAARPSGTEETYKIYAESFSGEAHLRRIQQEAQAIIKRLFDAAA